jgi:hypothetical protein
MNRKNIQQLRVHVGPAVSIISSCDQAAISLIFARAAEEIAQAGAADFVQRLHFLQKGFICPVRAEQKLAVFIDKHRAQAFLVPNDIPDALVIGTSFFLDSIIKSLAVKRRCWVFDSTTHVPVLRECVEGFVNMASAECSVFFDDSEDATHRQESDSFMRCAQDYLEADRLPIIFLGQSVGLDMYEQLLPYTHGSVGSVGSIDDVWSGFLHWYTQTLDSCLAHPSTEQTSLRGCTDLTQLMEYAHQGYVVKLIVRANYRVLACQHQVTGQIISRQSCLAHQEPVDMVLELIMRVRAMGHMVFFVASDDSRLSTPLLGLVPAEVL